MTPEKRSFKPDHSVLSRIAVFVGCFASILEEFSIGELRKSFYFDIKRIYTSIRTNKPGSTHIPLIAKCFDDAYDFGMIPV